MCLLAQFAPFERLAADILAQVSPDGTDGSHDLSHILRVWRNVRLLQAQEGGEAVVLAAASLLHDCVPVAKTSPDRPRASRLSAQKAEEVLAALGWSRARRSDVGHAIEAHSFSAGIAPKTLEARILQDADRLDALGYIGIARCFYVSGRMDGQLYDPADPAADQRALDDRRFALDHVSAKLLQLSGALQTETGRQMAAARHAAVAAFLEGFLAELEGPETSLPR